MNPSVGFASFRKRFFGISVYSKGINEHSLLWGDTMSVDSNTLRNKFVQSIYDGKKKGVHAGVKLHSSRKE
jgi:hypothetical protein